MIPPTETVPSAKSSPTVMLTCSRRSPMARLLEGRVGKRDFAIDPTAGTVQCPAGHTATITTSKKGVRTARISRAACRTCPLKERCCPGRESRQIALGEHEELILAARQALADPDTAAHLRHTRPRIRTAARAARVSIRRTEEPVHRHQESNSAGQLGGRVGEPQPDRPAPRYRSSMTGAGNAAHRASSPSKDHGRLIAAPPARDRSDR